MNYSQIWFIGFLIVSATSLSACGGSGDGGSSSGSSSTTSSSTSSAASSSSSSSSTSSSTSSSSASSSSSSSASTASSASSSSASSSSSSSASSSAGGSAPPYAAVPSAYASKVKTLTINWTDMPDATHYRVLIDSDGESGFTQIGDDIPAGTEFVELELEDLMLNLVKGQYILGTCNTNGCVNYNAQNLQTLLNEAIGYFKSTTTHVGQAFGNSVALSDDGTTLVVGASSDSINVTGIHTDFSGLDPDDDPILGLGGVYVFEKQNGDWQQSALIKAGGTLEHLAFGSIVSLSGDGNTLLIKANAGPGNIPVLSSGYDGMGAVYIFQRADTTAPWVFHTALTPGSAPADNEFFASNFKVSTDGNIIAVGQTINEDIAGSAEGPGKVLLYQFNGALWELKDSVTPSSTTENMKFAQDFAISADGSVLAVGVPEITHALIPQDKHGGVYIYRKSGETWPFDVLVVPSGINDSDRAGYSLDLSDDGNSLFVGTPRDDDDSAGANNDLLPGNEIFNSDFGRVTVFQYIEGNWQEEAWLNANSSALEGLFCGRLVKVNSDGSQVVFSCYDGDATYTGIMGDEYDYNPSHIINGDLVLMYYKKVDGLWRYSAAVKHSAFEWATGTSFSGVALSGDGDTLAVGARQDTTAATGIGLYGLVLPETFYAGAVFVY